MPRLPHENVVVISYDVSSNDDTNINNRIKDFLTRRGYCVNALFVNEHGQSIEESLPETTLYKVNITPLIAINDFKLACQAYAMSENRTAHGRAFAICNNEYEAVIV